MNEYIRNVIIACVFCNLVCVLTPCEASPSGKALKILSAFVMLFVILSPISDAVMSLENIGEEIRQYIGEEAEVDRASSLPSYGADELCQRIIIRTSDKFGIPKEKIHPAVTFDVTDVTSPKIASCEVKIEKYADKMKPEKEIAEYISEITDSPCVVSFTE